MKEQIKIDDFISDVRKADEEFAECFDDGDNIKNLVNDYLLSSMLKNCDDFFEWQKSETFPYQLVDFIKEKGDGKDESTTSAIFKRKSDGKHFELWMHDAGFFGPQTLTMCEFLEEVTLKTKKVKSWK
jgi:hypothetical protein